MQEHNHANNHGLSDVTKLRSQLKRKAVETAEPPSRLLAQALSNSTTSVRESIGSLETIRRDLRQQRSKVRPPEPQTTADIQLRDTWTMTGGPEKQPFLIYDNGPERRDRMLVFASHEQQRALSTSRGHYQQAEPGTWMKHSRCAQDCLNSCTL